MGVRQVSGHTHLVRGGSMMLRPTIFGWRGSDGHARKGHSINNPPLTRWVCAAGPFVCRLHHHGPTSDEVGMRENLTRTLHSAPCIQLDIESLLNYSAASTLSFGMFLTQD